MEIDLKDGKATLNISGTYSPEELRQLLRRLCEAHADLIGSRNSDGNPAMPGTGLQMFGDWAPDGSFFIAINSPVLGWVQNTMNAKSIVALQALLRSKPGVARDVGPGDPEPEGGTTLQ